jgi:DNA invertase Pin-like site-specific DNA recombinase
MNVICYARVSTKEQGDSRNGLQAQIEDMKRFCAQNNLNIIAIYEEVVSGKYDLDRRPILKQAFKEASKIKDCVVLTSKLDRLSRSAAFIMNLMEKNVKFIVAECGINCAPLMIHVRAVIAEDERKKIGERTKAGLAIVKAKGKSLGMHNPNVAAVMSKAVAKGAAANKAEADAFADFMKPIIARMRDTKMSVHAIADELNRHGNKTARGGQWYGKTVANMMARTEIS